MTLSYLAIIKVVLISQILIDYTKEEMDFQGEEDEKISKLRKQILQKEENRKNSQRKILLQTLKKVKKI